MADRVTGGVRRVFGVASLALRASLRTRVVAGLLALLAVCVWGLPEVVKGDGTPEGELRILLSYTLGFSFAMLCLATLWAACALFAAEIDSARIQLSAVKPVRPAEFWVGKWLALVALNAALLAVVYAVVYVQAHRCIRRGGGSAAECLMSRRVAHPVLPTAREEALEMYRTMKEQKTLPNDIGERAALRALEEKANERYDVVNPGEPVHWTFRLKRPLRPSEAVTVRVKFDTEFSTREGVKGVFRLSTPAYPGRIVEVPLDDFTQNEIEFVVDLRAFSETRGPVNGAVQSFDVAFLHRGDPKRTAALMLRSRQDVVLLTPGGSFEANMVRAALVQASVLALLAALGLALSACFSLPVAAFTATVLLVLTLVGNAVVRVVSAEDEKSWPNRAGIAVSRAVHRVSAQALKVQPLTSLTRGERIEGGDLLASLAWNGVGAPLLFLCLGCAVLTRRELADSDRA